MTVKITCRKCKEVMSENKFYKMNYFRLDGICKKCKKSKNYENDKKDSD